MNKTSNHILSVAKPGDSPKRRGGFQVRPLEESAGSGNFPGKLLSQAQLAQGKRCPEVSQICLSNSSCRSDGIEFYQQHLLVLIGELWDGTTVALTL